MAFWQTLTGALQDLLGVNGSVAACVIVGFAIGFTVAACVTVIHRRRVGRLTNRLFECGADSPETAKTVSELGFRPDAYRFLLRAKGLLRRIVQKAPDNDPENGTEAPRFYIPPETADRARIQYGYRPYEWIWIPAAFFLTILLAAGCLWILPILSDLFGNLFS